MRKIYISVILFFIVVIQIFAIDPVQFEIIQRFPNGTGPGEFRYHSFEGMGANPSSPEILAYEDGEFFIGDNVNNRMVKIGRNREWNILYTGWIPEVNLIPAGKFLVGLNLGSVYDVYDRETRRLLHTGEVNLGNAEFFFFSIIAGDMLFVQPHSGGSEPQYYGFFIPEDFDGKITMMDPERTIDFLKNDYDGTEEFTVDEEGYIFWDGKLVAPYGPTYYRYYYKTRDNNPTLWNAMQQRGFIGWDKEGNTYWDNHGRRVNVFTPSGELIADFYGENISAGAKSQFTVTPEGTLYVLSYNREKDEFELMKLDRFW